MVPFREPVDPADSPGSLSDWKSSTLSLTKSFVSFKISIRDLPKLTSCKNLPQNSARPVSFRGSENESTACVLVLEGPAHGTVWTLYTHSCQRVALIGSILHEITFLRHSRSMLWHEFLVDKYQPASTKMNSVLDLIVYTTIIIH